LLKILNLSKTYKGGKKAIDGICLTIEDGDIYGFIGHNGAGKTTTIKCITGILDFDEGEILINEKSIRKEPLECKKMIAYIPDNPDLYEYMTGIQYLNFISDIFEVSKAEREKNIKKYADAFELTSSLGDLISSYSHGMKQKLVIISGLIHNPKLLILDEPFVGLDPVASFTLKKIMKDFCLMGNSIFFSTHVLEVAEKLCTKVAIIKNGKIITSGTMENVKGDSSLEHLFLELNEHEYPDGPDKGEFHQPGHRPQAV
jgi:ABC-2 type transport system ATP-binding protein